MTTRKAQPPKIPKGSKDIEIEQEVAGYQSRLSELTRVLWERTTRGIDNFVDDVEKLMDGQDLTDPRHASLFLNERINPGMVSHVRQLVDACPERMRNRLWKRFLRVYVRGDMTNKRMIDHLACLNVYSQIEGVAESAMRILTPIAAEGYLRGTYTLQRSAGVAWNVDGLSNPRIRVLVDGVLNAEDVRKFMDPSIDMAAHKVQSGLLTKMPWRMVKQDVEEVKTATKYRSEREARTVITSTASDAHMESYRKHKVDQYRFVATYDERTCPVCGSLDGQVFDVDKAQVGTNYPPMHPNCRCTTVAKFSKAVEDLGADRVVTDRATGQVHKVPQDYTYAQWYKDYGPGRTDGIEYVPKYKKPKK